MSHIEFVLRWLAAHPVLCTGAAVVVAYLLVVTRRRNGRVRDVTTDVRERQFEIAQKGTQTTTLTTGFLSTCIAVYGWDRAKGIAFLWHLDFHPLGFDRIVRRLQIAAGGDISGFELYMTSGFGSYYRLVAAVILEALTISVWAPHHSDPWVNWVCGLTVVASVPMFVLFSWFKVSSDIYRTFGKRSRFKHVPFRGRVAHLKDLLHAARNFEVQKAVVMLFPRVEVTVDVEQGPQAPSFEIGDAALSSEDRFKPTDDSWAAQLPARVVVQKRRQSLFDYARWLERTRKPFWVKFLIYDKTGMFERVQRDQEIKRGTAR